MKRVIVTNNKKVQQTFSDKAEVIMLENASCLEVLSEGAKIAEKGGRLLMDPTRRKGSYRSLVFFLENEGGEPDEKSLSLINKCIADAGDTEKKASNNGSLLTGILQNRDLDVVKSIIH